ncbi:MAG: STAS domain-containing protein [Chloroflexi bacterium]|nr:STAS domain-containing protein [Chloroflexota bacterium]
MQITHKQLSRVDLVAVNGRVDASTAPQLQDVLRSIFDERRFRVVLDLSEMSYMSSAGLKVLLAALKEAKRWNRGDLRLATLQPQVQDTLNLVGLLQLFRIYPNTVEAVGSF